MSKHGGSGRGSSQAPQVFWYWPFGREENAVLPSELSRRTLISLTISTIRRPGGWSRSNIPDVLVLDDLPDVARRSLSSFRWSLDRTQVTLQRWKRRARAVRHHRCDIIHLWYTTLLLDNFDLRRWNRRHRTVLHVHDVVPHQRRLPAFVSDPIRRDLYRTAQTITVYHEILKEQLVGEFGVDPCRIRVIPMLMPVPAEEVDRSERTAEEPLRFLLFGSLRPNKGIEVALAALDQIDLPKGALRLIIAGRPSGTAATEALARVADDPRVEIHSTWISWQEKQRLFSDADVLLLPYTSFASQSAVLHDAHAFALPVIGTDLGALGESIRNAKCGWVVPASDPEALARAMADAELRPDLRLEYGRNSRRAAENHTPQAVATALEDVYFGTERERTEASDIESAGA